ncbi:uncharacterized protein LOC120904598 [Anopheles arabiensis]|uniref:uncharacterized protein LOC120904598 n=1 Tax=Anopheles arabiensis TaxID=7173 RepID=UPI001AACF670|nr:uncharacterized protein LOC120904598 [Anopheles arabiensis]
MCCSLKWFLPLLAILCWVSQTSGQENRLACGRRKVKSLYLIHNGIDAKAGHWPWHVALFHRKDGQYEYACGGSILDENTILTAAHCVYIQSGVISASRVSVDVGRIHLKDTSEYTQTHRVREIIVHPGFSKNSIINDIALIKLGSNITMNKYVQPVCLWTRDSNQESIVGKNGTIVGFGLNEQDVVSDQLKQAQIGVVDALTCIASDRGVFGTHLTSDMFCGKGEKGVSACNGDSGGGMFFEVSGKWYVRGLVSFTPLRGNTGLCDPLKYTAYTDVTMYLEWIKPYIDERVLSYESDVLDIDYEEKLRLFNFETCGAKSSSYAENGINWTLPWLGAVRSPNNVVPRCTITLISEWYAVGPAHCFEDDRNEAFIVLGSYVDLSNTDCLDRNGTTVCTHPSQTRRIQRVIVHPKFDRNDYTNNIALIELLSPADTTQPNVKPICLPVTSELRTNAKTNLHVATASTEEVAYKNIFIRYVESDECLRRYSEQHIELNLDNKRFCAEVVDEHDREKCIQLEAGAPLQERKIFNGTERYFLRGIELHGLACDSMGPTIYNDVEVYMDWILYNMRYNMQETPESVRISATNTTLEAEWNKLQKQPGKEKLRLFNMDTCGLTNTGAVIIPQVTVLPWIGSFWEHDNVDSELSWLRSMVVLISEWYAIAPKFITQNDVIWRFVVLGKYNANDQINCTSSTCEKTFQLMEIKNIITPKIESELLYALIEFVEPANLSNPYIKPICLPFMDQLHQHDPTVVVLSSLDHDQVVQNKKLKLINYSSCQQRFLHEKVYNHFGDNLIRCAVEVEKFRQMPLHSIPGSLFQMSLRYGDGTHYFLHGMDVAYPTKQDIFPVLNFGPYIYYPVKLADLEWMMENIYEKERNITLFRATESKRISLKPVQHNSRQTLFNFNTCGESSISYPTPWLGYVLYNAPTFDTVKCMVTPISELHAVGPADCFDNSSQEFLLLFGDTNEAVKKECAAANYPDSCNLPTQSVAIQKIFTHPLYNKTRNDDIALVKLATPVDTSRSNVKPICLPLIDTIRNYDTSSLVISSTRYNTVNVDDRYIDVEECQKRWQGLKVSFVVDRSIHCVMLQRTVENTCVHLGGGTSLHSLQALKLRDRHFLRGFFVAGSIFCSIHYPVLYVNTDAYLEWIIEHMEQPALGEVLFSGQ